MELSDFCDQCHQTNPPHPIPPPRTFLCRSCILFRPSWPVCREVWYPSCHPVCMVTSANQALLLWGHDYIYSLVGISLTTDPSREQPLNTRRRGRWGKWPPWPPVFSDLHGALPPRCTPGWPSSSCGFSSLSPHLSVLLAFRSLEPLGKRGPLCSVLQNTMLHQRYSDRLPVDPSCEWEVTSEESFDLRAECIRKSRVPWSWSCQNIVLLQFGFHSRAIWCLKINPIFHKNNSIFFFY